jgi:hypothetical protein
MATRTMHSVATSSISGLVPTGNPHLEARDPEAQRGKITMTSYRGRQPQPQWGKGTTGSRGGWNGGPPWANSGAGNPWANSGAGGPWANGGPPAMIMACWNGEGPCPPFVSIWMSSCASSRKASKIAGACGPSWVGPRGPQTANPTGRITNVPAPVPAPVTNLPSAPSPQPLALLTVKTVPRNVHCRRYADTVTTDWSRPYNITGNLAVGIACW